MLIRSDSTPKKQLQCSSLFKYPIKGKRTFSKANYISIGTKKSMTSLTLNFSTLFCALGGGTRSTKRNPTTLLYTAT